MSDELKREREHVTEVKQDFKEDKPVVNILPPSLSTNTASLNTRQDESPTTHENHHGKNTHSFLHWD